MMPFRNFRVATGPIRVTGSIPTCSHRVQSIRLASTDYGKQSGMEGSEQKNPMSHMEHPGPDPPSAAKGGNQSTSQNTDKNQSGNKKSGPGPAIHRPESAAEKDNPEVRKHNEELEQRYERTTNQLSEEDNKVDKKFWSGMSSFAPSLEMYVLTFSS